MALSLEGGVLVTGLEEGQPLPEGNLRIWQHFTGQHISMRVLALDGRATLRSDDGDQVLYIREGAGFRWAGTSKTPIAPGSCVYLPKGQPHCVENTTSGELRLLGVFYPAGSPAMRYPVHERADRSPEEDELDRRD